MRMEHDSEFYPPPLTDAAAAQQVRTATAARYVATFLHSAEGTAVLADLLAKFSPFQPAFQNNTTDPIAAARTDGRRDAGREIWSALMAGTDGEPQKRLALMQALPNTRPTAP